MEEAGGTMAVVVAQVVRGLVAEVVAAVVAGVTAGQVAADEVGAGVAAKGEVAVAGWVGWVG